MYICKSEWNEDLQIWIIVEYSILLEFAARKIFFWKHSALARNFIDFLRKIVHLYWHGNKRNN
ncbi:hypothetical protein TS70_02525 [Spiroplasma sp. hyd1]|nr:hypothetical protein [Spiroplasma sp. hyd1]